MEINKSVSKRIHTFTNEHINVSGIYFVHERQETVHLTA